MTHPGLEMRFDPNTIEHLGVRMYSQIPTAIAELIANSYDADAKEVIIILIDEGDKKIIVRDNGTGMTFDEINKYFLTIGRNRREEGQVKSSLGRITTGKKGLGKLALFGIGDTIEIVTVKNGEMVHFRMNWIDLKNTKGANYTPKVISRKKCDDKPGTTIILSDLKRKSPFDEQALAISISRLFNFFDKNFKVVVQKGDVAIKVDNALKYASVDKEFEFKLPEYSKGIKIAYQHKSEITGTIITSEKPLKPEMRGITLFANGRLVNRPEFFGRSESSHFYSYVTGWLDVDFVDNWTEDVISTNRQSLNWDLDNTRALKDYLQTILQEIHADWRQRRKEKRRDELAKKLKIDIKKWYGKLPGDVLSKIESIVNSIETSELSSEDQSKTVANIHDLIPEYPYYHWRHLHEEIKKASSDYYQRQDYYGAFLESVKKYSNATRSKSGVPHNICDDDLMAKAFHLTSGNLTVTSNYLRANGQPFSPTTLNNIQEGHFNFSKGVIAGGRNPVAHEEIKDLRASDLFSEKDCLDLLSLLSHLHKRLDNAKSKTP